MSFSEFWTETLSISNYLLINYWWIIAPISIILGFLWYRLTNHLFFDKEESDKSIDN